MRILLLGYGKMGKVIERIALSRNHTIVAKIDADNRHELSALSGDTVDVAIEFSQPESAVGNLRFCLEHQIPIVCGTTGWLDHKPAIEQLARDKNESFFYASNFSIGVNLFFQLNKILAQMMETQPQYEVSMTEIHHTEKKDAPSGTAITLAEGVLESVSRKSSWVNTPVGNTEQVPIVSLRESNVPGTHTVRYDSSVDTIEIKHTAHSREGFAQGAVVAAEWLVRQRSAGRRGAFGMEDLMNSKNQ